MDDEVRSKIFDMHGSVQRLEAKTDRLMDQQEDIKQSLTQVEDKADRNQRRLYGIFLVGSIALGLMTVSASLASTV